jgi:tetrahedral aminopeptidase
MRLAGVIWCRSDEEESNVNVDLFSKLVSTPGISGREERIRKVVREEVEPLVDDLSVDSLGNLSAFRRGRGPRLMLAAHMDSIGFLVSHIDDDGFIRISPIGGFDPRTLVMQRVLVQGRKDFVGLLAPATKPIHILTEEDRKRPLKLEDLFIDLMLEPAEVKANISIGDPVSMLREPFVTDRSITAPYLDDRLGVYVLIESLRKARDTKVAVSAVFSVQEEVGLRGATTSAFGAEPEVGVALDVTIAADLPGADKSQQVSALGKGVAIGVMDASAISDPRLVARFKELASASQIDHQMEILPRGGTDAGAIQMSRAGVPVITISIPVRYVHTVNETALISDVDATVELVSKFLDTAHELELSW